MQYLHHSSTVARRLGLALLVTWAALVALLLPAAAQGPTVNFTGLSPTYSVTAGQSLAPIPFTASATGGYLIDLSLSNAPAWVTLNPNTSGDPASASLIISPPLGTIAGDYQFAVVGAPQPTKSAYLVGTPYVITVTVLAPGDPAITGAASYYRVRAGNSVAPVAVTCTDPRFPYEVSMELTGAPTWVTLTDLTPGNPATATLNIAPPVGTPVGLYPFTITEINTVDKTANGGFDPVTFNVTVEVYTTETVSVTQTVTPTNASGGPGATVNGGQAIVPNTSGQPYALTNIQLGFDVPAVIGSATVTVTAGGVTRQVTVSPVTTLTNFPINPALVIPANSQANVQVSVTLVSRTSAALPPSSPSGGPLADSLVLTALVGLLGALALRKVPAMRPQWAMMAAAIVLSATLYGCGGGGSTSAGPTEMGIYRITGTNQVANLTLESVTATDPGLTLVNFSGLPASLGQIQLTL